MTGLRCDTHTYIHTHTMEYYSAIKKNEIRPSAATRMDLENTTLSEKSQRKTNMILYHLYMESKKIIQMNVYTKQVHRHRKQTCGYQRGEGQKEGQFTGMGWRYTNCYI